MTRRSAASSLHSRERSGYALVLAIVVLAALFAIATPFLLSARASARTSGVRSGDARARLEADAVVAAMVRRLEETDPEVDSTPSYDSPRETSPELDYAPGFYKLRDSGDAIVSAHAIDEQGKIDVDSASPNAFGLMFGHTFLTSDLKEDEVALSVRSTEGFPDAGMLWLRGELIRYQSKSSSRFEGCTRGVMGSEFGPYEKARAYLSGSAVLDARAHALAKFRVRSPSGGYRPYETLAALARARGEWPGADSVAPTEIERAKPWITLWAARNGHEDWSAPARIASAIVPDGRVRSIQVDNPRYFGRGVTVRIEGPEGIEYGLVVAANGSNVTLEEPLTRQAAAYTAKASVLVPHPVNVNSCPRAMLEAMLTGLHLQGKKPLDVISPEQAHELAGRMKAEPVKGWKDLCERILKPAMDDTLLTPQQVVAVVMNGENCNDQALGYSTLPFTFASGGISTIVASASMNAPSGIERGRIETESVVEVHRQNHGSDEAGLHVLARQFEMDESFRLSRRARGWMTYPFATSYWDAGADPPPRYLAMFSRLGAAGFDLQLFGAEEPDRSYAQLAPARIAFPDARSEHFDIAPMPEGNDLGRFPWSIDAAGGVAQIGDTSTGYLYGGSMSGWFRFDQVSGTVFDFGADSILRDRITLSFDQGDLVMRMRDSAGDDPDPARLVANEIRFPAGGQIQPNLWYHFTIAFRGSGPTDYALFIDGLPRGERRLATTLTGSLASYVPGDPAVPIPVESTAGFPAFGVLRIGNELVEYSSKTPNSFLTQWTTTHPYGWIGSRGAREFTMTALNSNYAHASGETVVLYGYSARMTSWVLPGGGTLPTNIGRFSAAKVAAGQQPTTTITVQITGPNGQPTPVNIGEGFLGKSAQGQPPITELLLDPVDASDGTYMDAFPATGGYAVMFQFANVSGLQVVSNPPSSLFGCELIRYAGRAGNKLNGIQRGVVMKPYFPDGSQDGKGAEHAFVTKWLFTPYNQDYRTQIYVVPCSIPVGGVNVQQNYFVPAQNDWAVIQLLDGNDGQSPNDGKTEWVEYDSVSSDGHFMRLETGHWNFARGLVTTAPPNSVPGSGPNQQTPPMPPPVSQQAADGMIGEPAAQTEPWIVNQLRLGLQFRGTHGTWSQPHALPTQVMAAFLTLRTPDPFGGRPGRLDRMCILEPQQSGPTYWRTINWASVRDQNQYWVATREHLPKIGIPPGQLVVNPNNPPPPSVDSRDYTRMVKTPSGELPRKIGNVRAGGAFDGSGNAVAGLVDEIEFSSPTNGAKTELLAKYIVASPVGETDLKLPVEDELAVFPHGMLGFAGANFLNVMPADAGVLLVGNELIAYDSYDGASKTITVAPGGRGFLGTRATAHGTYETAVFLNHLVASQLSAGADPRASTLTIESASDFPPAGTVLIGSELMHYTRMRDTRLEMPEFEDEADISGGTADAASGTRAVATTTRKGTGIFRGRYGTMPATHNAGDVVIRFPYRYADKWVVGSDAPELHYYQVDDRADAALWKRVYWKEEQPIAGASVECLARLDARSLWTAEPGRSDGLWLFTKPTTDGAPNPVMRRGERLEMRFGVRYANDSFDVIAPNMTNATKRNDAWKTSPRLRAIAAELVAGTRVLRREERR